MTKTDIQNREDIERLIFAFYEQLLKDEELGFIFTEVAKINLLTHLPILYDFWESVLFHTGNYKRNAMQMHLDLHQKHRLTEKHFNRWLSIFDKTVDDLFLGPTANRAKVRALSIATVIQMKIATLPPHSDD